MAHTINVKIAERITFSKPLNLQDGDTIELSCETRGTNKGSNYQTLTVGIRRADGTFENVPFEIDPQVWKEFTGNK